MLKIRVAEVHINTICYARTATCSTLVELEKPK